MATGLWGMHIWMYGSTAVLDHVGVAGGIQYAKLRLGERYS